MIPVLALALFAGLRGVAHGRRTLFVLPTAWLLGGIVGLASTNDGNSDLTVVSFLLLGGLVAADAHLSLRATTVIAALLGLQHGYLNGAGMGQPGGWLSGSSGSCVHGICSRRGLRRLRGAPAVAVDSHRGTRSG